MVVESGHSGLLCWLNELFAEKGDAKASSEAMAQLRPS